MMKNHLLGRWAALLLLPIACCRIGVASDEAVRATRILDAAGVSGGVIVHLDCGDGKLTAALGRSDSCLVQGLDESPERIEATRRYVRGEKLYGKVSIGIYDGKRLPYADNLVNLVIVSDGRYERLRKEIERVLAPLGAVCVQRDGQWEAKHKPWPSEMDQWPQYLHGADNNGVSEDRLVGPPRRLQWVAAPQWSRSHMAIATVHTLVTSRGRLFSIEDTASPENPFLPGRFALVARDAFNGVVLWERPLLPWEPVTRYIKDISTQLQRRVVAVADVVYCTPGLNAPLTALDARNGAVLRTFAGTERTQEFSVDGNNVFVIIGDRANSDSYDVFKEQGATLPGFDPQAPFGGTGFRGAYAPETRDKEHPVCDIVSLDIDSGSVVWKEEQVTDYVACSFAVRGPLAVWQTKSGLTCVDRTTGKQKWQVDKDIEATNNPSRQQILSKLREGVVLGGDAIMPNTVVLSDQAVYSKEGKTLIARSLEDGSEMWTAPIADNYHKSADLFLAAGRVWTGGTGKPTAYDPKTGLERMVISQKMTGPMGHDRCYRNFITERFYINSKTGGADFIDLETGTEFPNYWLRGTCGMGVIPANGMIYVPPYSCQCSAGAMIQGMNALAGQPGLTSPDQDIPVERTVRWLRGPAYGEVEANAAGIHDWPTYRYDAARGGSTPAALSADLKLAWETPVGSRLSPLVVADEMVFVADVDAHSLLALDVSTGGVVWDYFAGGRIDSPPTYYDGTVLFGSRDGWVHCLRAADGALVWKFRDLPDRLICAQGQLESAWPMCGSILVRSDTAYFVAGRSSFLDGGILVYALDASTGEVKHRRRVYGPFDPKSGFPSTDPGPAGPFKADILVAKGDGLYVRHRGFQADLSDLDKAEPHVMTSAGFLNSTPQHRTYWTIGTGYAFTVLPPPSGDILVADGQKFFEVSGFPVGRHSYFDTRVSGYRLIAGQMAEELPQPKKKRRSTSSRARILWNVDIPLTGHAMVKAGDVLFVAGTPAYFPPDHHAEKYEAAYAGRLGGILWAASASDGSKLAEYKLDTAPCWDAMAVAGRNLFLATRDGKVLCFKEDDGKSGFISAQADFSATIVIRGFRGPVHHVY